MSLIDGNWGRQGRSLLSLNNPLLLLLSVSALALQDEARSTLLRNRTISDGALSRKKAINMHREH